MDVYLCYELFMQVEMRFTVTVKSLWPADTY